ncbi:MAG: helix-turn-helix domain-containing protein [Blautia wexlerae]
MTALCSGKICTIFPEKGALNLWKACTIALEYSRIKQLRENRGLIQEILAAELGITQQMLSKYERDILCIKVDVLMKIAEYFNVTTDYLLGISEVKRDLQGQMKMNKTLDTYYDLIEIYKDLDEYDQKMVWSIMQTVKKTCEKRKKDKENTEES